MLFPAIAPKSKIAAPHEDTQVIYVHNNYSTVSVLELKIGGFVGPWGCLQCLQLICTRTIYFCLFGLCTLTVFIIIWLNKTICISLLNRPVFLLRGGLKIYDNQQFNQTAMQTILLLLCAMTIRNIYPHCPCFHFSVAAEELTFSYCLKSLNISSSKASAVRNDLKTAKKGGLTRDVHVTGFPCQMLLFASKKSHHDKLISDLKKKNRVLKPNTMQIHLDSWSLWRVNTICSRYIQSI